MDNPSLEHILTTCRKAKMIACIQSHPENFGELIELALSEKQPYAWRASWLLCSCMDDNDMRLYPHIEHFIDLLLMRSDSQKREFLKILQRMKIDGDSEGKLFDHSLSIWENVRMAAGLRYHAFKMLLKIVGNHPALQNEVQFLTEPHYLESLSPGIRHSVLLMMQIKS